MISNIQRFQQQKATQTRNASEQLSHRTIVAHIGDQHNHHTFAWTSRQTVNDAPSAKIVISLCADLPQLHLEAITLADEILILNLCGYIDPRTLHEVCYAHNLDKPITWLEDWQVYCPRCKVIGSEAVHFFHNALSLHDLNALLAEGTAEHLLYLSGQLADWYGQIVPVVLLPNGLPALQVELTCPRCDRSTRTTYAVPGDYGAWVTLVEADGTFLVNLCEADERVQALACLGCASSLVPDKTGEERVV